MRDTNASRTERPTSESQTDLWADGLSKPTHREERHERVKRFADDAITKLAEALDQGRSEALTQYLATMSRFHRYSFGNVLLIAAQRPDATHVAGFRKWLELERSVMKGEKGIAILAPMVRKARGDTSPEEGAGEQEAPEPAKVIRGFRVVYVFDVKQTEGKPLPQFSRVAGDPGEHLGRLKELMASKGIKLEYVAELGGALGTSSGGTIQLLSGQTPAEEFSVLAHEIAHEMLHWRDRENVCDKRQRETEAESVAFVVTSACGLETGTAATDYIQLYRGDKATLLQSLGRIQETASEILAAVLDDGIHPYDALRSGSCQDADRIREGLADDGEQLSPTYRVAESLIAPRLARTIRGPDDVFDVCRGLRSRRFEEFHVLLLNARHEVMRRVMVSRGSLNASIVHPREVFRPAIVGSAASIVLVHNHPSGDPEPSDEDLSITRRLAQVGELHGIAVLDHVVVAKSGFVSLRSRGHI